MPNHKNFSSIFWKYLNLCFAVNNLKKFTEWANNSDLQDINFIYAYLEDEKRYIIWDEGKYDSYPMMEINLYEPSKFWLFW